MERTETLGDRVRRLRSKLNMTQQELADKIGLSYPSVNEIENGVTVKPRRGTLIKLCDFFKVSEAYLLTGKEKAAEPFLPGGEVNEFGATVMPRGGLRAALGDNFGEDVGQPMHTGKPVKTQADYIAKVTAEADEYKAEAHSLRSIVAEQREAVKELQNVIRSQQKTIEFLQGQVEQLQLLGKADGNHYDAPGTYAIAEPVQPIGFGRVRSHHNRKTAKKRHGKVVPMWAAGQPDVIQGLSSRKAA